jgi:uncharacterized protein (DUF1501 family)
MKGELTFQTRREFLRTTLAGGALSWSVPAFLANTLTALEGEAADAAIQKGSGRDSNILVVLQMAGGNDGLNTIVPHSNDHYHRARPRLGVREVLKIDDTAGFNESLAGFKALYDAGHLSVVQGVGYPNPNRSHFRSTEIWQTAVDADQVERHGWLGRYFDNTCAGCDPTIAVNIGRQMPQAFAAKTPTGVSLDNPQNYRFLSPEKAEPGKMSSAEESFRKLNQEEMVENPGGSVGAISGSIKHGGSALDFLERTALDAQVSSDRIRAIAGKFESRGGYPASQLGNSLKLVAGLIGGGLETRVFYVSQGGYDTHTNQAGAHDRLLKDLGDSVKAFMGDIEAQGNLPRVLLMTFSEFGRRVAENASGGTDHGAAAPMFLAGGKVKAGLLGEAPGLAPGELFQGDLKYKIDFRSVYAAVLEGWLKTPSRPILGKAFPPFRFL